MIRVIRQDLNYGEQLGRKALVKILRDKGMSLEEICETINLSKDEVNSILLNFNQQFKDVFANTIANQMFFE